MLFPWYQQYEILKYDSSYIFYCFPECNTIPDTSVIVSDFQTPFSFSHFGYQYIFSFPTKITTDKQNFCAWLHKFRSSCSSSLASLQGTLSWGQETCPNLSSQKHCCWKRTAIIICCILKNSEAIRRMEQNPMCLSVSYGEAMRGWIERAAPTYICTAM